MKEKCDQESYEKRHRNQESMYYYLVVPEQKTEKQQQNLMNQSVELQY